MTEQDTPTGSANTVHVRLQRQAGIRFQGRNDRGHTVVLDGPEKLGGADQGIRPMELMLVALAGCSAVDVVHILGKQRQPLEDLQIDVEGHRADAVPAVFESISLSFVAVGDVDAKKLERAVGLAVDKYCSVAAMLTEVEVHWTACVDA